MLLRVLFFLELTLGLYNYIFLKKVLLAGSNSRNILLAFFIYY